MQQTSECIRQGKTLRKEGMSSGGPYDVHTRKGGKAWRAGIEKAGVGRHQRMGTKKEKNLVKAYVRHSLKGGGGRASMAAAERHHDRKKVTLSEKGGQRSVWERKRDEKLKKILRHTYSKRKGGTGGRGEKCSRVETCTRFARGEQIA